MTWRRFRVVRIVDDRADYWAVVSMSLRDDMTWDVIGRHPSRELAFAHIEDIHERNRVLERAG